MTDGIIQKVFNNYLSRIDNMPWDKKDLSDLQQELIEKIKQAFDNEEDKDIFDTIQLKQKLIGDTQQ